jgi:uncharacterized membrane protein YphA (DoxX/SURF4 family)
MNARHKYAILTVRLLLGALMLFSGVMGLKISHTLEGVPPDAVASTQVLIDTGIFYIIKITEVVAGLMLITNFLPALATIFLAPDAVGILVVTARTMPEALPIGIAVVLLTAYLGYAYWPKYQALFER